MKPNNIGGHSSIKDDKTELTVDEDIELDDDIRINDRFPAHRNTSSSAISKSSRPTIAGIFLIIAFFLNLMLPITYVFVIYDAESATGNTTLSGQVQDDDEKPVDNVTVSIIDTNLTTKTDSEGKYSFESVPVGVNEVQFSKEGYKRVRVRMILFSKDLLDRLGLSDNILDVPSTLQSSLYLEPFDGPYNETVIIDDNLNRTLRGIITNQSGVPLDDTVVTVVSKNNKSNTNQSTTNSHNTQSDENGRYTFTNITPGIITLQIGKIENKYLTNITILFASNKTTEMNITYNDQKNQSIDLVNGKFGSISGSITDSKNIPVENVRVILNIDTSIYPNNIIITKGTGTYSFNEIPLGIYEITVLAPDFKVLKLRNITVSDDQNNAIPVQKLTELKPVDLYEEDISGAYLCTVVLVIFALITLFGAISAFQRKRYSFAFMGAIFGMVPIILALRFDVCVSGILCVVSLVLLVFSRSEFDFKK